MGIVQAIEIAVALGLLVAVFALVVEVRRGRRIAEEIRDALDGLGEEQNEHREALFLRSIGILRAALDEGKQRAVVFDPPRANDVEPPDPEEPPAAPALHLVRDAEEPAPEKPSKR